MRSFQLISLRPATCSPVIPGLVRCRRWSEVPEQRQLVEQHRPRADQAHGPQEDVPQLWKFIQGPAPQCPSGVMRGSVR